MYYIIAGNAVIYIIEYILSYAGYTEGFGVIYNLLTFNRALIFKGQVWRLFTFVFLSSYSTNIVRFALNLYFYYLIGTELEKEWGSFRFTFYYLIGFVGAILFGLITGFAATYYLNLSLFLAYAVLFPDRKFLLFYVIPVKVKWLALLDGILFIIMFIFSVLAEKIAILLAIAQFILFFGRQFIINTKQAFTHIRSKLQYMISSKRK